MDDKIGKKKARMNKRYQKQERNKKYQRQWRKNMTYHCKLYVSYRSTSQQLRRVLYSSEYLRISNKKRRKKRKRFIYSVDRPRSRAPRAYQVLLTCQTIETRTASNEQTGCIQSINQSINHLTCRNLQVPPTVDFAS